MSKYKKMYDKFCDYCKTTSIRDRLKNRNINDYRLLLTDQEIYVETHHIIPRSCGGLNNHENLVVVLPEEHLMMHKIRYKAFNNRNDMLAVRFIVNGLITPANSKSDMYPSINHLLVDIPKKLNSAYSFIKQHSYTFRKRHGWQTDEGRKKISEARKGKMPVMDSVTFEIIGSVPINHPKILSGEWIHITKIKNRYTKEQLSHFSNITKGSNNPRYIDVTNDDILDFYIKISKICGCIPTYNFISEIYLKIYNIQLPKSFTSFRFDGDVKNLINLVHKNTNLEWHHGCSKAAKKYIEKKGDIINDYIRIYR